MLSRLPPSQISCPDAGAHDDGGTGGKSVLRKAAPRSGPAPNRPPSSPPGAESQHVPTNRDRHRSVPRVGPHRPATSVRFPVFRFSSNPGGSARGSWGARGQIQSRQIARPQTAACTRTTIHRQVNRAGNCILPIRSQAWASKLLRFSEAVPTSHVVAGDRDDLPPGRSTPTKLPVQRLPVPPCVTLDLLEALGRQVGRPHHETVRARNHARHKAEATVGLRIMSVLPVSVRVPRHEHPVTDMNESLDAGVTHFGDSHDMIRTPVTCLQPTDTDKDDARHQIRHTSAPRMVPAGKTLIQFLVALAS